MKVIFSLSIVGIIYFGSTLGLNKQLDFTGHYESIDADLQTGESLYFDTDGTFQYSWFSLNSGIKKTKIHGSYIKKGNEISLIMAPGRSNAERLKKANTAFESGVFKLKPKYFLKLTNGKLVLCKKDIRKGQYKAILVKK